MNVRYGIVGCGAIHNVHIESLRKIEGAAVSGVYDVDRAKACESSDKHGVPWAPSIEDLFDRCDAVCVCVPSGMHAKLGTQAANAGKHVIVEKPIDVYLEPARALVDRCAKQGVKLTCISQHRFSSAIRRLHDAAGSGELGKLLQGDAYVKWYRTQAYYDSGDWRGTRGLDGGCLMNQTIHYIDMIQWIMGGVRAVQGQARTLTHDIECEDSAAAIVEFRNGASGIIQSSTSFYPGFTERLEVHGEHGSVVIDGDRTKLWQIDPEAAGQGLYGGGVMQQPAPNIRLAAQAESDDDGTSEWGEQHRLQLEDFTQAIIDDREPFLTGTMALEPLKVILAIYESSANGGRRVEVS